MGTSRETGGRGAVGGASAGGERPAVAGPRTARGRRRARAAGYTGRVTDQEFIQATGVNPRTGRRVRRRG